MKTSEVFHRINIGINRGAPFEFQVDGVKIQAYPGETIATALLSNGWLVFRKGAEASEDRAFYCGMGVCWECRVSVNGLPNVRACMTLAEPGMRVEIQKA